MKQSFRVQAITDTTMLINFAPGDWFATEPAVLVTVYGDPTDVDATMVYGTVDGAQVYTGVSLVFAATAVGHRVAILVSGDG